MPWNEHPRPDWDGRTHWNSRSKSVREWAQQCDNLNVLWAFVFGFKTWFNFCLESTIRVLPHPTIQMRFIFWFPCIFSLAPQFFCQHDSPSKSGQVPVGPRVSGLGQITWWIVMTKKNEGPFGGKNCTEIEKYLYNEWSELWVHRDSWLRAQFCAILEPKTNAQFFFFAVKSIALSCGHIWARLLQPLAQSVIGSAGTLVGPTWAGWLRLVFRISLGNGANVARGTTWARLLANLVDKKNWGAREEIKK